MVGGGESQPGSCPSVCTIWLPDANKQTDWAGAQPFPETGLSVTTMTWTTCARVERFIGEIEYEPGIDESER